MREYEIASEMYSYFYRKYTQGAFGLSQTKTNLSLVRNFHQRVKAKGYVVGVNWLFDYMAYLFYHAMTSNYKSVYPAFIFGVKAFSRWEDRNTKSDYYIKNFLHSRNITKHVAIQAILEDVDMVTYTAEDFSEVDEKVKGVYGRNLFACLYLTSLWNPTSLDCSKCDHVKQCKEVLKEKNLELYTKRTTIDES